MPAGVQLSQLIQDLRAEAGQSMLLAHGIQTREAVAYLLNRTQTELSTTYDWPRLKFERNIALVAGSRYYNFDADIPFEGIREVWCSNGPIWNRVSPGITPAHLSEINSDLDQRGYPVQYWEANNDQNQIEVWPIPNNPGTLKIIGYRPPAKMLDDEDVCEIDGTVIVMFAASELLAEQKSPMAPLKLQRAQEHLRRVMGASTSRKNSPFVLGGAAAGSTTRKWRPGIDYIP